MSHPICRTLSIGGIAATTALLGLAASPAASASPGHRGYMCTGGSWDQPAIIPSGIYRSLTVTGICMIPDGANVTVRHNVLVRPGAVLHAITSATVHIRGSAYAEHGAILGLGCTQELGCSATSDQWVRGSVIGYRPLAVYLNGTHVRRNVLVHGGGPGIHCTDNGFPPIGHDLPIKDNTIGGSVVIDGWAGCWAGLIRNNIGGSVIYANVKANVDATANPQGPDSNEIVANTIGGFLACWGNNPKPQYGDAGGPPYATNHAKLGSWGQCRHIE